MILTSSISLNDVLIMFHTDEMTADLQMELYQYYVQCLVLFVFICGALISILRSISLNYVSPEGAVKRLRLS